MTARIIDGKALAREVEAQARARSEALASRPGGRRPGLAVVLVGEDPASCVYVKNKTRACERAGVISTEYRLPADTTEKELLELIEKLNNDLAVDGNPCSAPAAQADQSRCCNSFDFSRKRC